MPKAFWEDKDMKVLILLLLLLFIPIEVQLAWPEREVRLFGLAFSLPAGRNRQKKRAVSFEKLKLFWKICEKGGIKIKALSLEVEFSAGDSSLSAQLYGLLWAVWGAIRPVLPPEAVLKATPVFTEEVFLRGRVYCIFRLIPGYIMITTVKILIEEFWKGGFSGAGRRRRKKASN